MNARLAAQMLSNSVADAVDYLNRCGHPDFLDPDVNVTSNFIRIFDKAFDVMNARRVLSKGLKGPLTLSNSDIWSSILNTLTKYIVEELLCEKTSILKHRRKTFAVGFLINAYSFKALCLDLLRKEHPLKYFLSYKCSQDHIELLFCCIRSRGGWNNNPSTSQFRWALRQMLFRHSIPASNGNCSNFESEVTPIGCIDALESTEYFSNVVSTASESENLVGVQKNILHYIAGYIARNYLKKCNCIFCNEIIITQNFVHMDHDFQPPSLDDHTSFTRFKTHGRLVFVSNLIYEVVRSTENLFVHYKESGAICEENLVKNIVRNIVHKFIEKFYQVDRHPVPENRKEVFNTQPHVLQILEFFSTSYCTLKLHTYAKDFSFDSLGSRATLRSKLTKTVLFYHI